MFPFGVCITIGGVYLLSHRKDNAKSPRSESSNVLLLNNKNGGGGTNKSIIDSIMRSGGGGGSDQSLDETSIIDVGSDDGISLDRGLDLVRSNSTNGSLVFTTIEVTTPTTSSSRL